MKYPFSSNSTNSRFNQALEAVSNEMSEAQVLLTQTVGVTNQVDDADTWLRRTENSLDMPKPIPLEMAKLQAQVCIFFFR